eukprot:498649_1
MQDSLAFLFATVFSICSDSSQDGSTFISNTLHDAVPDFKEYSAIDSTHNTPTEAMDSTHLRGEINQANVSLSFPNTCAPDDSTISSNKGMICPTQNTIDLETSESNRIQSNPFDDALHDAVPGSTHNAPEDAMDSTHLREELNHANATLSYRNTCASDECAISSSEVIDQIETHGPHAEGNMNPNALVMMQSKASDTCHEDQGRIKGRKERNQVFRTTASSSTTIITPSSVKPVFVRSIPIKKEKARLYSRQTSFLSDLPSVTSTHSLCLNCNVKFPTEFKFFQINELKTYFSDEDVHGTDGHYTQNRDTTTLITNRLFVHVIEYEWRLIFIGVEGRNISSDSRTVSLFPLAFIEAHQKDTAAFKMAFSQISYASPYHCYLDNDVHSSSLPKDEVNPFKAPPYPAHTKYKKHVESQRNEGITPIPALFIKSCIGIIALSCATILFIKSSIRTTRLFIISFTERKAFLLVFVALSFRPSSAALSISIFSGHTCVLQTTSPTAPDFNSFKCFGRNDYGQCGYEHSVNIGDEPNQMGASLPNIDTNCSIDDIKQVETGHHHTCILTNTGKVKCWGNGGYGRLGYGNNTNKGDVANTMGIDLPFIDLGGSWSGTQIAAGVYHTCALLSNATNHNVIKCFGRGISGALGIGDTENRGNEANEMGDNLTPIDLGIGFDPIQITTGDRLSCALSASKKIKCFGWNNHGQLGIGDTLNRGVSAGQMGDDLPVVALGTGFTPIRIEAAWNYVCALSDSGKVKCWGNNDLGQLGLGHTRSIGNDSSEMNDSLAMVDLGSNLTVTQITAGRRHTCALFTIGNIKQHSIDYGKVKENNSWYVALTVEGRTTGTQC